jgi:hypothetical protein
MIVSAKRLSRLLTNTYIVPLFGDKEKRLQREIIYILKIWMLFLSSIIIILGHFDNDYTRALYNDFTICLQHNYNRWADK